MADKNTSGEKHIAVLAFPFASHPGAVLSVVRRLAKVAPHFTISYLNTAKSNASLFSSSSSVDEEHKNIRAFDVPDGVPEGYVCKNPMLLDVIDMFLESAKENFKKGIKQAEEVTGKEISCVISDSFLWFSCEIAEELRVPWIPIWLAASQSLSIHLYTDLIRQNIGIHGITGREEEIITFVPGLSQLRLGDLPVDIVNGMLESRLSNTLYKMGQVLHLSDALIMNSIEEIDPEGIEYLKLKLKNVLNVGPSCFAALERTNFHDPYGCIPWLDKHEKGTVAYLCFGTVASPPPHELKALAEALEETNIPFIWSLKDDMKTHLPQGFIERTRSDKIGKIVRWAPQVQILGHQSVGVFLNHCGWSSIWESITTGVPIICRPCFGDQAINCSMMEKILKIGVRINGDCFTKDSTMEALELVLKKEEGKKMKDQIMFYKKLAMKAAQPNGSANLNLQSLVQILEK